MNSFSSATQVGRSPVAGDVGSRRSRCRRCAAPPRTTFQLCRRIAARGSPGAAAEAGASAVGQLQVERADAQPAQQAQRGLRRGGCGGRQRGQREGGGGAAAAHVGQRERKTIHAGVLNVRRRRRALRAWPRTARASATARSACQWMRAITPKRHQRHAEEGAAQRWRRQRAQRAGHAGLQQRAAGVVVVDARHARARASPSAVSMKRKR